MATGSNGRPHDAANTSTRPVLCLQRSGCTTQCADGCNGQPTAGIYATAAAAATDDDDDDGSTATTGFKPFWKYIRSHGPPPLWLRCACSDIQSLFRPYLVTQPHGRKEPAIHFLCTREKGKKKGKEKKTQERRGGAEPGFGIKRWEKHVKDIK